MARRLFTLGSAVSLLLCVAVCVLWVRSVRLPEESPVSWLWRGDRFTVRSRDGRVTLHAPPAMAAPEAAAVTREVVALMRNDDLNWRIAAADRQFREVEKAWIVPRPGTPSCGASQWYAGVPPANSPPPDAPLPLLLRALEDPDRFVVAHYVLGESRKPRPRAYTNTDAELLRVGDPIHCRFDGLLVELRNMSYDQEGSGGRHYADFTASADPAQLPAIREQWHRRLDRAIAVAPWWALTLGTALLPAISGAALTSRAVTRRSHRLAGRCPACGYDLRATPGRCPECGTVPVTKEA